MFENFPRHIRGESERLGGVFDELREIRFKKGPIYSANLIRYALMLRYSSLQAYRVLLEEFNLPSLSLLRKITKGKIDALATAKALRDNGCLSKDVILIFDEMYLQKCEEFGGGEMVAVLCLARPGIGIGIP